MTSFAKFGKHRINKLGFTKLGLLLTAVLLLSTFAAAQSSQSQPANSSESQVSAAPPSGASADQASSNQATTGESKEAPAEDETAPFKHSPSVKLLSKITGLSIDGAYWLAVILNFAIVAGVIFWFSKKNLPAMFRSRTATIQKSLEEARTASADAKHRLAEIESRLKHLGEEIGQMQSTAETSAAAEDARIKAAAEEDARRIVESAQQEIAAAAKAARRELTAHAADLAVTLASQQIRVDAPTDQALVRRFAKDLMTDGAAGKKAQ
jgi:F-type H+-transporting ATPase subunit b